jgi:LmbE family N-acetylglucosaminyl deacetylase
VPKQKQRRRPSCRFAIELSRLPDGRLPAYWNEVKDILHAFAAGHSDVDVVFAPRIDDAHQDHRLLGTMAPTVWRDALVLHYEIPKWDGDLGPIQLLRTDLG